MNWFKKHQDLIKTLSTLAACFLWLNSQLKAIDSKFAQIEKDLAVIKTVLIIKGIMPNELAKQETK